MKPAYLHLETGETFEGFCPEWQRDEHFGEVVFNTSMMGYVEALTDPSYKGQILTFSYPLLGNYGVPSPELWESKAVQVSGMICSSLCEATFHSEQTQSLQDWLEVNQVPVMVGVDTRALVKTLRSSGVALGAISTKKTPPAHFVNINEQDLVASVVEPNIEEFGEGDKTVLVVDCGIKKNILRHFEKFPVKIKKVPYDYDFSKESYDGLFISNGPGDPSMCTSTIASLKKALKNGKPTFGICLGSQIMALAIGAKTYKLPFGHRAQNHPCINTENNQCYLTSQNHGFAVDEQSLPADWQVAFKNLNDGTVQGIAHKEKPYFSVQFHPEAAPGPIDTTWLFEKFYELL